MMLSKAILAFLFLFVGILAAKDVLPREDGNNTVTISKRAEGVKLDLYRDISVRPTNMQNEASEDVFLFSSIAVFPEGTTITKPELIRIAHDAHNVVRNEKGLDNSQIPAVTSALLVGNEVYLSTSARYRMKSVVYVAEGNPAIKPDVPRQIRTVLDACFNNPEYSANTHFNEAQCGEIMGLWAYFKRYPDQERLPPNSFSAAWELTTKPRKGQMVIHDRLKDPCDQHRGAEPSDWGCKQVLPMLGVQPILRSDKIEEATSRPDPIELWQVALKGGNCNPVKKAPES